MEPRIALVKAEFNDFLNQYTVYKVMRNNNRFNIGEDSIRLSIIDDRDYCRFIYYAGIKAGGVILRNGTIKYLFLNPSYEMNLKEIAVFLHREALIQADREKGIACLPSDSAQAALFSELGYETIRKMRCMVSPLHKVGWRTPPGYMFRKPAVSDSYLLSELFYEANVNEPWHQPVTREFFSWGVGMYFDSEPSSPVSDASSICILESTGEAVGACLVSFEEGYPFIFDLHVRADHRRKGIAMGMLGKAMAMTSEGNDFMRLFVIDGNPARNLYEKAGFIAGNPVYVMRYSLESGS